mmetsp:Transcript_18910/g.54738  ORF Transcript_18910/g.54738 Transcript_18910/m.54738 type:complete len:269 (+) Transcript_18910:373-1179(+)
MHTLTCPMSWLSHKVASGCIGPTAGDGVETASGTTRVSLSLAKSCWVIVSCGVGSATAPSSAGAGCASTSSGTTPLGCNASAPASACWCCCWGSSPSTGAAACRGCSSDPSCGASGAAAGDPSREASGAAAGCSLPSSAGAGDPSGFVMAAGGGCDSSLLPRAVFNSLTATGSSAARPSSTAGASWAVSRCADGTWGSAAASSSSARGWMSGGGSLLDVGCEHGCSACVSSAAFGASLCGPSALGSSPSPRSSPVCTSPKVRRRSRNS